MWRNFFKHNDIHPENMDILDGNAADQQPDSDAFEEKTKAVDGIELLEESAQMDTLPSMSWSPAWCPGPL